jgi:hypothetical protein
MINKVNMRKWVAALRSGDFLQGQERLATLKGGKWFYCCLGVACELALADGVQMPVGESPTSKKYDGSGAFLPRPVQSWLGLEPGEGEDPENPGVEINFRGLPERRSLSHLNDNTGFNFGQIADLIEEHYKLLEDDGDTPGTD